MKILLSLAVLCSVLLNGQPSPIALRNARIVTVSGPVIAKGTVLMRDGLIAEVGENVSVPTEAWVIDAQGLTVYPGLIDALSTWGIPPAAAAQTASRGSSAPATPVAPGRRATAAATEPVAHGPEE